MRSAERESNHICQVEFCAGFPLPLTLRGNDGIAAGARVQGYWLVPGIWGWFELRVPLLWTK